MTLLKLRAIPVALVMLIGLVMAYAYPPSRVWALIRAKQLRRVHILPAAHGSHGPEQTLGGRAGGRVMLPLAADPLGSAAAFNVSNCPGARASQTSRFKSPPTPATFPPCFPPHFHLWNQLHLPALDGAKLVFFVVTIAPGPLS